MPGRLTLLAPGLLGPWPGAHRQLVCEGLEVPALSMLLARAALDSPTAAGAGPEAELAAGSDVDGDWDLVDAGFDAFAVRRDGPGWPAAAMSRLVDLDSEPGTHYLRADPVHLRADPHGAHLSHGPELALDAEEAVALAGEVQAATAATFALEVGAPERWYVRLDGPAGFQARSPTSVIGPARSAVLPAGVGGAPWRAWLTEVQMILHASPVNAARERAGLPAINSLWLWGAGCLPAVGRAPFTSVFANDRVIAGLALHHGLPWQERPADFAAAAGAADGHWLVAFDEFYGLGPQGAVEHWQAALRALDANWLTPALAAMREAGLESVQLCAAPAPARTLSRRGLRHFWKRRTALADWLVAE